MKIIDGGVTAPKGFKAAGVFAGIKKEKKDMALIYSEETAVAAGVFTKNVVKAAPVILDMEYLKNETARAIVVNSGNANACTKELGYSNAVKMSEKAAELLGIKKEEVFVSSTGVIGYQLPMDKIIGGIESLAKEISYDGGRDAALAIMTTDTFMKEYAVETLVGDKTVKVGGMSKGSGMIHPNMATMLCYITTDAAIEKSCFQKMIKEVADKTFNMITVDGDTSTNDTLLALANGMAGNDKITGIDSPGYEEFYEALLQVSKELAIAIARDGEGATKLVTVEVRSAASEERASIAAKSVCGSNLVKTAVFGEDANWGRILAAIGYSGIDFDPDKVDINIRSASGVIEVARDGVGIPFSEEKAKEVLKEKEIFFDIEMNEGEASAMAWCCDFSYDYVRINADYRS